MTSRSSILEKVLLWTDSSRHWRRNTEARGYGLVTLDRKGLLPIRDNEDLRDPHGGSKEFGVSSHGALKV